LGIFLDGRGYFQQQCNFLNFWTRKNIDKNNNFSRDLVLLFIWGSINPKLHHNVTFLARHLGEKNFPCDKCDMRFDCNSARYHHILKIHEGVEFRCHFCGKDFAYKKGLRRHIRNVHEVVKGLETKRLH